MDFWKLLLVLSPFIILALGALIWLLSKGDDEDQDNASF